MWPADVTQEQWQRSTRFMSSCLFFQPFFTMQHKHWIHWEIFRPCHQQKVMLVFIQMIRDASLPLFAESSLGTNAKFFHVCLSVEGHDSSEDASACMELMIWKIKEDAKVKRWPLTPLLHFPPLNFLLRQEGSLRMWVCLWWGKGRRRSWG